MTTVTLKIEPILKDQSRKKAQEFGLSLSALIKTFLSQLVKGQFDFGIKPRYHGEPEPGDIVFKDLDKAVAYFKRLADEDGDMEENVPERLQEINQAGKKRVGRDV